MFFPPVRPSRAYFAGKYYRARTEILPNVFIQVNEQFVELVHCAINKSSSFTFVYKQRQEARKNAK